VRFLVDTNILVYAAHTACAEHEPVTKFLANRIAQREPFCFTWGVIYEFLKVATHRRILARPMTSSEALTFVSAFLDRQEVSVLTATSRHREILEATANELSRPEGNLFHDIETAVLAREHGVPEIITADTDFLQFRFLKVTNPLIPRP
jgi:toxin-antitoxin system PIN domain toxin